MVSSACVVDESDDRLWVEISDGVIAEFLRMAISRRLDDSEPGFEGISEGGGEEDPGEFAEGEAFGDTDGDADGDGGAGADGEVVTGEEVATDETEAIAAEPAPEAAVVNEAPAPHRPRARWPRSPRRRPAPSRARLRNQRPRLLPLGRIRTNQWADQLDV